MSLLQLSLNYNLNAYNLYNLQFNKPNHKVQLTSDPPSLETDRTGRWQVSGERMSHVSKNPVSSPPLSLYLFLFSLNVSLVRRTKMQSREKMQVRDIWMQLRELGSTYSIPLYFLFCSTPLSSWSAHFAALLVWSLPLYVCKTETPGRIHYIHSHQMLTTFW